MEKISLPIKTKIAAWIITVMGGILGCFGLVLGILGFFVGEEMIGYFIFPGIGIFIGSLLIFLPGLFLLKKKRLAWWFCIIILITVLIILIESILGGRFDVLSEPPLIYFATPIVILFIISFFLLLLDKRNFWKITEKEAVEKVIIEKEVREKRGFKKIILVLLILFLIWFASGFLPSKILNPSPSLYNLALKTKNEFFCFINPPFSVFEVEDRSNCYFDLAIERKDVNLCKKSDDFYFCAEKVAEITKDESICEKLSWSVGCYRRVAETKQDPTLCEKIIDSEQKDVCYRIVAEAKKDSNLCTKIIDSWERDNCYYHDFFIENDPTICGKISNKVFQKGCYEEIQTMIKDETADWQTYKNEEYGYAIRYPPDTKYIRSNEYAEPRLEFSDDIEFIVNHDDFSISVLPNENNLSAKDFGEEARLLSKTSEGNQRVSDGEESILGGYITFQFDTEGVFQDRYLGLVISGKIRVVYLAKHTKMFRFMFSSGDQIFNQMLSTFKFLE